MLGSFFFIPTRIVLDMIKLANALLWISAVLTAHLLDAHPFWSWVVVPCLGSISFALTAAPTRG